LTLVALFGFRKRQGGVPAQTARQNGE
jgi:hypothetical protein